MENSLRPWQCMNRDIIKYIAIICMVCNHIANAFMLRIIMYNQTVFNLLIDVGSFTAISMVFFLVEGYHYTHSKKQYITRLLIFAFISQIPFMMAFADEGFMAYDDLNMLFTLAVCFLVVLIMDKVKNIFLKIFLVLLCIAATKFMDWPYCAAIYTVLFAWAGKSQKRRVIAFIGCFITFMVVKYTGNFQTYAESGFLDYLHTELPGTIGMVTAAICILLLYNGKRMEKGRTFSKWFFYVFYPAHLVIIGIIRYVLGPVALF